MTLNALLEVLGRHPQYVLWAIVAANAIVVLLIVREAFKAWRQHEEQKAELERFRRIAHACSESKGINYPPARGAKGFDRHRRKAS